MQAAGRGLSVESCLYVGRVRHRRFRPVRHDFSFPLFLVYLDLAELDRVFRGRWLWSTRRAALARFRREDHLGDPHLPLDEAVRALVAERTGRRPTGPIRLLTHLRYAGFVFNPVSFFYCYDPSGRLDVIVADVANTPWNERHRYVLSADPASTGRQRFRTPKQFHVSPFLPMDLDYAWTFLEPCEKLAVRIENRARDGQPLFDAVLALRRREITGASLASALAGFPLLTFQVLAGIYWQAFRLHRKGAPYFPHPALAGPEAHGELETPT
jgi:hypothetical protein